MFTNQDADWRFFLPSSQVLEQRISRLEGRWRPEQLPRPLLAPALGSLHCIRVVRLGAFWPGSPPHLGLQMLLESGGRFLSGLAAAGSSFLYILGSWQNELQLILGAATGDLVEPLLVSTFPGLQTVPYDPAGLLRGLDRLACCHALVGLPSLLPGQMMSGEIEAQVEQVDGLVRGLAHAGDWAVVVAGRPLQAQENAELLMLWGRAVEQASLEFQLPNTTQAANRLGQHLVTLLETQFQRAQRGRIQGNWLAQAYIFSQLPAAAPAAVAVFAHPRATPEPLQAIRCQGEGSLQDFHAAANWWTTQDLSVLTQLPRREHPGFAVHPTAFFDVTLPESSPSGGLNMGWVQGLSGPTGQAFRLPVDDLTAHALLAGATGSGKTSAVFHLLRELANAHVPFLVIEPTKGEYRALREKSVGTPLFPNLQIYTMGSPEYPIQINPFYVPPGVPVQMHVDFLYSLFAASFVLYAPMPYVLEAALYEVYQDKGWDLAADRCWRDEAPSPRAFPTLTELYDKIDPVVDRLGYDERIRQDVKAALKARLNSLRGAAKGMMLDTRHPLDMGALLKQQVVIEMGRIGDDEQKAFLIGLLLTRLYEQHLSEGLPGGPARLRHVTVIEEAHRLLQNTSAAQGGDFANPRGKAVETFANLISEIRAYGEGLLIVDQSPLRLAPDVLKNTNLKIAFRIVSGDDRDALARVMNLQEEHQQAMVALEPLNAVLFSAGMDRPMQVRFPRRENKLAALQAQPPAMVLPPGRAAGTPGAAGTLVRWLADGPDVQRAFARWVLSETFASSAEGAQASRQALGASLRAAAPVALRGPVSEAAFLKALVPLLSDRLAVQIGSFYHWPFQDEQLLAESLPALWQDVSRRSAAAALLESGLRVETLPYAACSSCPAPCRYRLFAARALPDGAESSAALQPLREYDAEPTQAVQERLLLHARYLSQQVCEAVSDEAAGAAFCLLVQLGQRLGWRGESFAAFGEQVWKGLQKNTAGTQKNTAGPQKDTTGR